TTEMVTKDEILKRNIQVPFDLPSNKPLRLLQIGNYPAMPDGGTHLKNTKESWPVRVTEIKNDGEKTVVMYAVESPEEKKEVEPVKQPMETSEATSLSLNKLRKQ